MSNVGERGYPKKKKKKNVREKKKCYYIYIKCGRGRKSFGKTSF